MKVLSKAALVMFSLSTWYCEFQLGYQLFSCYWGEGRGSVPAVCSGAVQRCVSTGNSLTIRYDMTWHDTTHLFDKRTCGGDALHCKLHVSFHWLFVLSILPQFYLTEPELQMVSLKAAVLWREANRICYRSRDLYVMQCADAHTLQYLCQLCSQLWGANTDGDDYGPHLPTEDTSSASY